MNFESEFGYLIDEVNLLNLQLRVHSVGFIDLLLVELDGAFCHPDLLQQILALGAVEAVVRV